MFTKDELLQRDYSPHSPHTIIPSLIKLNMTVLDVGCNTGFLAEDLNKKNCKTDGIDINTEALKKAKKHCRAVYKRDLYKNVLNLPQKEYDYIIFADILEHLPRPDLILEDTTKYLKKDATVIISLPNIARFELRIKHLFGSFEYAPGIMSFDHLRFFTKRSAKRMIKESGYDVVDCIPTGLGHRLHILPELTAFQFIFVCQTTSHS